MAYNTESIDTCILLRIYLNDVPEQRQKAIDLLKKPNITYGIADLAISETVYVLETVQHEPRENIVAYIQKILGWRNINCNRPLFTEVLPTYLHHPSLSFNDCCLATYAALNHAEPLWTFDHKLAHTSPTAKELK